MNEWKSKWHDLTPQSRQAIIKWIVQSAGGVVTYGVIIFLAASRQDWVWGWVWLGLLAGVW
jgi:hypothetical protein